MGGEEAENIYNDGSHAPGERGWGLAEGARAGSGHETSGWESGQESEAVNAKEK